MSDDNVSGGTAKKQSKKKNNISKATTIHRYSSKPKVDPHVIKVPKSPPSSPRVKQHQQTSPPQKPQTYKEEKEELLDITSQVPWLPTAPITESLPTYEEPTPEPTVTYDAVSKLEEYYAFVKPAFEPDNQRLFNSYIDKLKKDVSGITSVYGSQAHKIAENKAAAIKHKIDLVVRHTAPRIFKSITVDQKDPSKSLKMYLHHVGNVLSPTAKESYARQIELFDKKVKDGSGKYDAELYGSQLPKIILNDAMNIYTKIQMDMPSIKSVIVPEETYASQSKKNVSTHIEIVTPTYDIPGYKKQSDATYTPPPSVLPWLTVLTFPPDMNQISIMQANSMHGIQSASLLPAIKPVDIGVIKENILTGTPYVLMNKLNNHYLTQSVGDNSIPYEISPTYDWPHNAIYLLKIADSMDRKPRFAIYASGKRPLKLYKGFLGSYSVYSYPASDVFDPGLNLVLKAINNVDWELCTEDESEWVGARGDSTAHVRNKSTVSEINKIWRLYDPTRKTYWGGKEEQDKPTLGGKITGGSTIKVKECASLIALSSSIVIVEVVCLLLIIILLWLLWDWIGQADKDKKKLKQRYLYNCETTCPKIRSKRLVC
jgi:hypothetical protein